MERAQGFAQQGNRTVFTAGIESQTVVQESAPFATVTVFLTGTTILATLFSDNQTPPTPLSNPFTANADGYWFFYAADGRYDVMLQADGHWIWTISDLILGSTAESVFGLLTAGDGIHLIPAPSPPFPPNTITIASDVYSWQGDVNANGHRLSGLGSLQSNGEILANGPIDTNTGYYINGGAFALPNGSGGIDLTNVTNINGTPVGDFATQWINVPGVGIYYPSKVGIHAAPLADIPANLFIIDSSAGMLFGDPTLSGTMFLLATTDTFQNGLVDIGANLIWKPTGAGEADWHLIDTNNDGWLLSLLSVPAGSAFTSGFAVYHAARGTTTSAALTSYFEVYGDSRAHFLGEVGIGVLPVSGYSALRVQYSLSTIAEFTGTTNGNHWIRVQNSLAATDLGVGALPPTAGVPYVWSSNNKFFIGPDGSPSIFIDGPFMGVDNPSPIYNVDVHGNVNTSNCYLINGVPLACTDGSGGINLSNITTINGAAPSGGGITVREDHSGSFQRVFNVTYTNPYPKPMFVAISVNLGPDNTIIAYTDGAQVGVIASVSQDFTLIMQVCFWVFPGGTYKADSTASTNPITSPLLNKWIEYH